MAFVVQIAISAPISRSGRKQKLDAGNVLFGDVGDFGSSHSHLYTHTGVKKPQSADDDAEEDDEDGAEDDDESDDDSGDGFDLNKLKLKSSSAAKPQQQQQQVTTQAQQSKRRPAPGRDFDAEEGDGELNIFEKLTNQKKDYKTAKKAQYTHAPRYAGIQETVDSYVDEDTGKQKQHKRGASYEIMKNKGLTPHRKKENRNPRVKKRMMYEDALKKRKSQCVNLVSEATLKNGYEGQKTGINARVVKSRRIGN
jgi:U3 small nucleolar RNA-associated protein 3